MNKRQIETVKSPYLEVQCSGDLRLRGWDNHSILIHGQDYTCEESEKGYVINSSSDLSLMVPTGSRPVIKQAGADLAIKNVKGKLELNEVSGDASLMNLETVEIGRIDGDLSVKNINGPCLVNEVMGDALFRNTMDINIRTVYGDCAARNVNGDLGVDSVMGDLSLGTVNGLVTVETCQRDASFRNLAGIVTASLVHGDIRLRGGLPFGKHHFNAEGDIVLLWPPNASLSVTATAPKIKNKLPLEQTSQEDETFSGQIGDGETVLILTAKGRIIMKELAKAEDPWEKAFAGDEGYSLNFDLADLGDQISDEINAHMSAWSEKMENGLESELAAKIERKAQEAAAKAERAADRAIRKAERAARQARWRMDPGIDQDEFGQEEKTKTQPSVSEEEQLKILRMVEEGIITPDEAVTLLEALEE